MFSGRSTYITNKGDNNKTLKIAIAPVVSPRASMINYSRMIDYLSAKLDIRLESVFYRSYTDTNNAIKNGECDIAFICTGAFLQDKEHMRLLVVPQINGRTFYNSYIIVNSNSQFKKFEELKNHSFAFTDPLSLTGYLYVKYRLIDVHQIIPSFFSKVIYTSSHDRSIELVSANIIDGAAVDSIVYESLIKSNKEIRDKTRIIEVSEDFGIPPVVVRKGIDEEIFEGLKRLFTEMHLNSEGREILSSLEIEKFVESDMDIYQSTLRLFEVLKEYEKTR